MTFTELREKHPMFKFMEIFPDFQRTETGCVLHLKYLFSISGIDGLFTPTWEIPCKTELSQKPGFERLNSPLDDDPAFWRLIFSLGMAELVSYWKIACPPKVQLPDILIDKEQEDWWKRLYFGGLGEFFYRNGIKTDFDSFMQFDYNDPPYYENYPEKPAQRTDLSGYLIPVGGGKDSIVTLNLLKDRLGDAYAYQINHRDSSEKAALLAGIPKERILEVKRTLDPNMLRLNKEGYLNGHTPFSAIVAFSAALTAYINGLKTVVLSNESSASESTVSEAEVNHQYSKSYQFERDFYEYEQKYLRCGVQYFSLLRPLTEFQIARYFASLPTAYHEIFRSCNAGAKQDKWCGHCAKCLFVAVILSPFLPYAEIVRLLGSDLFNLPEMEPVLQELCGALPNKPFECVGSRKEVNISLCLAIRRAEQNGEALPKLLAAYRNSPLYAQYAEEALTFGQEWDPQHNLPDDLAELVRKACVEAYR
ncbi:MAG: hypothetical protein IKI77_10665 [Oscillospiraceae bacterium]|nr:hypothetical protein [Oscillospiraceae bacterium]